MPQSACPVCRRVGCTDPTHTKWYRQRKARPVSNAEKERRAAAVKAYKREHGWQFGGRWVAQCPACGRVVSDMTAEHVVPYALGGREDGPLSVLCRSCNSRQGAAIVNARRGR